MFLLTEIKYSLFRSPIRTMLLAVITILLMGSAGLYFRNVQANEDALNSLSDSVPVSMRVTNRNGSKQEELLIDTKHFNAFVSQNVYDVKYEAILAAGFNESAKGRETPFTGGDTIIKSADSLETLDLHEDDIQFAEEWDATCLEQAQPVCIVSENYALEHGLSLGDKLELAIYSIGYKGTETIYTYTGDFELKIIGFCPLQNIIAEENADVILPIRWLQEIRGEKMTYDSLSAKLRDPLHMNEVKDNLLEAGFINIYVEASDLRTGDAIIVDDELFIRSAGELKGTLWLFTGFLIPFFCLICALMMLALFLLMQNSRREIAIADSLGRPRWLNGAAHFIGAMFTELSGCVLIFPFFRFALNIPLTTTLLTIGAFLICAGLGSAAALILLFQFDSIELLTKQE